MYYRYPGSVILAGILLILSACSTAAPQPPPVAAVPTLEVPTATPSGTVITYQVQRGDVLDLVQMRGRIAAAVDQDVFFSESGYIKELYVQRNDMVTAGQLLAEIDLGELPVQLERAQADLNSLEQMSGNISQQRDYAVQSARLNLQAAQDRLNRLQEPPSSTELDLAQSRIDRERLNLENTRNTASAAKTNAQLAFERAANALRNAQDTYSRVVWENGNKPLEDLNSEQRARQEQAARAISDAETVLTQAKVNYDLAMQQEVSAVALAENSLKDAEAALSVLLAPPDPFELREAERAVNQAQINLNQAISNSANPEIAGRMEDVRRTIGELEEKITSSKLYAPFDGMIAEIGVKPGDLVDAYAPIINLIDPRELNLVVSEISGDDLLRIAPGQTVDLLFERYPDSVIPGVISQLPSDQVAADSLVRPNRLLRISFDAGGRELMIGDTAVATLVFSQVADTLWLPPQAIYQFDQRMFVLVRDESGERPVDVTVGLNTPERVEIVSGLQEGDTVVVNDDLVR